MVKSGRDMLAMCMVWCERGRVRGGCCGRLAGALAVDWLQKKERQREHQQPWPQQAFDHTRHVPAGSQAFSPPPQTSHVCDDRQWTPVNSESEPNPSCAPRISLRGEDCGFSIYIDLISSISSERLACYGPRPKRWYVQSLRHKSPRLAF